MTIRVGIFGLGTQDGALSIGAWGVIAHLKSIQALPEYEIVAVANSTVESAKRTIARWGFSAETKAYGNPEDLARDPNVDLVVVSVNVAKHFFLTKPALENKKNVFVEWPLGASLAEAEELTKLAAAQGVKTMVGTQGRADPLVQRLKVLLEEGKIGRVLSSTVVVCNSMTPIDTWFKGVENYLDFKSGGNEFDIHFAHFLDTFTYVLGDFVDVQGILKSSFKTVPILDSLGGTVVDPAYPKTAPDHVFVQGMLERELLVSIAVRKAKSAADSTGYRWLITGTEGEILVQFPEVTWQFSTALSSERSLKLRIGKGDAVDVDFWTADTTPAAKVSHPGTNTARLYENFAKPRGEFPTFESALKIHQLLDMIAKSAGWNR